MTHVRKGSFIKKAKDISISGALALALFSSGMMVPGCSPKQDEEADYSYEETTYSKGIRSHIKEVKPGEFKITDEESVEADQSVAIVTYLDGHTDSLSTTAAKALIDEEIKTNGSSVGQTSGLSSMLLYGGMGYMLARNMNNGYMNNLRQQGPNGAGGVYANQGAYSKSQAAVQDVNSSRSTRVVNSRPSGGRSGFFGRSSGSNGG
jgi:hypothetical protein